MLGFDRSWVAGEGAHLIDAAGDRYLDLLAGCGVFALGRNHPAVRAQLERALAAGTANLPQLGATLLAGVLAARLRGREPRLLNLAEVRLARLPMTFSSAKAQRELGYGWRPAAEALAAAARWFGGRAG